MARVRRTLILALLAVLAVQVLFVRWLLQGEPATGRDHSPPPSQRPTRAPDAHVHRGFDLFTQDVKKRIDELWEIHMGEDRDSCSPKADQALSTIKRAKTQECKELLRRVGCLSEAKKLYPESIPLQRPAVCRVPTPAQLKNITPLRPPARIAFMFAINGRSLRQVIRLLRAMYRPQHWYLFHVDARSEYLSRELEKFLQPYPNAWVAAWRLSSIWGSANLHDVYVRGMRELLEYDWDYFFNLSETDFPIGSVDDLADHLRTYADARLNLFRGHGNNHARFISKQGLDHTFVLCEGHMWRVGPRTLPNLAMEGGSDWFILHRSFAEYVTSSDPVVTGLRLYYDLSLLSAESFFHVVAANSMFCPTLFLDNFRVANWRRERGCHCQYKHIVDWCGCSPNVFIPEDMHQIKSERKHGNYFARKFDPRISNAVVSAVERRMLGIVEPDLPAHSYWESIYDSRDIAERPDVSILTYLHAFARIARKHFSCAAAADYRLLDAYQYLHEDRFAGYTVALGGPDGSHEVEFLVQPAANISATSGARLLMFSVGATWDDKEQMFKRFGGLLTTADSLTAAQLWHPGPEETVQLVWQSPEGSSHGPHAIKVAKNAVVSTSKLESSPLAAGLWRAALSTDPAVTFSFPVANVHPRADDAPLIDQLIGRFWAVTAACCETGGPDGCEVALRCSDAQWSSRNPRGTVRAWPPDHIP